jgi:hypothetical protein
MREGQMKTLLIACAGALAFSAATAQDITTGHLSALDTNGDGAVDAAEFGAFVEQSFAALDQNGDGYVTIVEGEAVITPEQFAAANANGDDGLSKQEFQAATQKDFATADTDGSGALN